MWSLKTTTVPVIVRVMGVINKEMDKPINSPNLFEIQKIALYGTVYLLRRVRSI